MRYILYIALVTHIPCNNTWNERKVLVKVLNSDVRNNMQNVILHNFPPLEVCVITPV